MADFIKRITARTVGIPFDRADKKTNIGHSFTVIGKCYRATLENTGAYDPYYKFGGMFEAMNEQTGEVFESATLIVPDVVSDQLATAVNAAQEDDSRAGVEFAIRFKTVKDENSIAGFTWACEQLVNAMKVDPLKDLRKHLTSLPAPDKKAE